MFFRLVVGLMFAILSISTGEAQATTVCPFTYNFASGAAATAAQVNQNFQDLSNCFIPNTGGTMTTGTLAGTTLLPGGAITSAGNVGIGTASPGYLLDVRNTTAVGQLHLSGTGNDEGGYILGFSTNGLFLSGGGEFNGTTWVAKAVSSSQIALTGGTISFFNNTGLTSGTAYTRSQSMTITTAGTVGVGTTSPNQKFDVLGYAIDVGADWSTGNARTDATTKGGFLSTPHYLNAQLPVGLIMGYNSNGFNDIKIGGGTSSVNAANLIEFMTGATSTTPTGTTQMVISSSGQVGIGTTSPSYTLHVNGSVAGTSAYNNISDVRLKKDVVTIDHALEQVEKLRGVRFQWRTPTEREVGKSLNLTGERQIGFIAQEVEKVLPEAVSTGSDDLHSVQESKIAPLLVEAVKEQQSEIEELKTAVRKLSEANDELRHQINHSSDRQDDGSGRRAARD